MMEDHQDVPTHTCPLCEYKSDCVSSAFDDKTPMPRAGDITMCLSCGVVLVFNKDLSVRLPNDEEKDRILHDSRITLAQIFRADIVGDKIKKRIAQEESQ